MELETTFRVIGIRQKSHAELFKKLKVGDMITITMPVTSNRYQGRLYSQTLTIKNVATGQTIERTFNTASNALSRFEFEKV